MKPRKPLPYKLETRQDDGRVVWLFCAVGLLMVVIAVVIGAVLLN